jgi:hypothetical protein
MKNRFKHALPRLLGGMILIGLVGFLLIAIVKIMLLIACAGALIALAMAYFYKKRSVGQNRKFAADHAEAKHVYGTLHAIIPVPVSGRATKPAIIPIR